MKSNGRTFLAFILLLVVAGVASATLVPSAPATGAPAQQNRFNYRLQVRPSSTEPALWVRQRGAGDVINLEVVPTVTGTAGTPGTPVSVFSINRSGTAVIPDTVRAINMPLGAFIDCQTDAGALIGFDTTADALADYVNSATDGTGRVLRFDDTSGTEDQSMEVCQEFMVPPDYSSGGSFRIRAVKDAHTAATEVLNCAVSVNGAALQTAGTVTTSAATSTAYTCTPTISALAVNDSVSMYLSITSDSTMNDIVDVAAVEFVYTSAQ